jgi:protein-disulfide isomerase
MRLQLTPWWLLIMMACAHGPAPTPPVEAPKPPAPAASRPTLRQDLGGSIASWTPVRGPADAVVTIVEFGDFQCRFCASSSRTLEVLRAKYGDRLRVAFRHLPLQFHDQARTAAEASMFAAAQGRFWPMYDRLFSLPQPLKADAIRQAALDSGVDLTGFEAAMQAHTWARMVDDDLAHAREVDARGTPTFYVNGTRLVGSQPVNAFERVIDAELKIAAELVASGVAPDQLYDLRLAAVADQPRPEGSRAKRLLPAQRALLAPWTPIRGPAEARVTIVEYGDFQCPFCARAARTLEQLRQEFGADLRIAFRHQPRPFHTRARRYAQMAFAAQEQGKFWEMHDYLFEHQKADGENAEFDEVAARAIGLDVARYRNSLAGNDHEAEIDEDLAEGQELGITGTPTFYINGKTIVGAQPIEAFRKVIIEARGKAQALIDEGVAPKDVYEKTLSNLP